MRRARSHEMPEHFKLFMGSMEQGGQTTYFVYSHIDPDRGLFIVFESADIAAVYEWALTRAFFVEVPKELYVPPEMATYRILREER